MKTVLEANNVLNKVLDLFSYDKVKDIKNKYKPTEDEKNTYLGGSISNYVKDLVLTFPVLCDNSLPPTTASMISRANERSIVTMLQILFSSMQFNAKEGREVIQKIHKNISTNYSLDDAIDAVDKFIADNGIKTESSLTKAQLNECVRIMMEQLKTPQKSFPVESLSERSLNEYTVYNINGRTVVRETTPSDDIIDNASEDELKLINARLNAKKSKSALEKDKESRANDIANALDRAQANKNEENKNRYDAIARQLMDSDIKKANELQPTLMIVRFNELGPDNTIYSQKPFVTGVKSRLISVDSEDIIDRISVKNKTKVNFLNFVRATTGEISFVKDFILCLNQNKIDAKNAVKKGEAAKMWKVLENRSSKNFLNKNRRAGNDASAITTLVINQETVNILKKESDFDLEQIKNAKSILDAYNLLGIIICDQSIEVAKVLYAGNDNWEQQAYSYLEKESNDSSYKKVINLIGKMNGR